MKIRVIGCSHHQAPVDLRAKVVLSPERIVEALHRIGQRFSETEAVLLSTCNRTEFYLASNRMTGLPCPEEMVSFLAEFNRLDAATLAENSFYHHDEDAVRHLFLVAASLDSMVIGEAQILSQVKQAYQTAREQNATGPVTQHLFEKAYGVAKRVASETAINRKRVSIPSVAVADCAKQMFESFSDKNVLVIGAGQMGEETLRYLQDEGARNVVILNRHADRASQLAASVGGVAKSWERLPECLERADLVVSTTGASEPIISFEQFQAIARQRAERTLFILDLAVPRDFSPEIGVLANVYLYCIDDLRPVCEANRRAREKELPRAKRIVDEETRRYLAECKHRSTGPTIQRLKRKSELVKQEEMRRLINKLGDIDERSRREIERAFDRLVNKLLHPALESLRDEASHGSHRALVEAFRRLFQIND
jgi:glutamyl-tRNA reductase